MKTAISNFVHLMDRFRKPKPAPKTETENWVDVFGDDQLTIDEAKISMLNICQKYGCFSAGVLIKEACRQLSNDVMENFIHDEVDKTSRNRKDWDA